MSLLKVFGMRCDRVERRAEFGSFGGGRGTESLVIRWWYKIFFDTPGLP